MKRLDLYVGRVVIAGTLMVLLVLLSVDLFVALVSEVDHIGEGRYGFGSVMYYLFLTVPRRIVQLFPVSALVGGLLGLGAMSSHHELVVFRSSGASLRRLAAAVIAGGLIMVLAVAMLAEFVAPTAEQSARFFRETAKTDQAAFRGRYGFWARDGDRYVRIQEILPGGLLRGVYVYQLDSDMALSKLLNARQARYREEKWVLHDVLESQVSDGRVATQAHKRLSQASLIDPDFLDVVVALPENLSARDLRQYIRYLEENGLESDRYRLAFWARIAAPFGAMVMMLLALPFVLGKLRDVASNQRVMMGVLIGLGFYLFNQATLYMGTVFRLEPVIAAFLPVVIFAIVVLIMLRRAARP